MENLPFSRLPLAVKIAVGISIFTFWMCIEEFFIDRYGIWKFMPYYKVADACVWDLAVAVITIATIWRASTRRVPQKTAGLRNGNN